MSCNYADGLSPYHDKGQLGLDEKFDSKSLVSAKVSLLTKWINEAKHVVIHTGAGISTSAGIPDFRGPRGVWTLEAKGEKPDISTDFNEAVPTITHMAITKLVEKGKVKYVISQNIDGLHLRSNLGRKYLSELHGNMFIEQCNHCHRQFVRGGAVPTVGQKSLNKPCPTLKPNGRPCRGKLHDCILDWEHNLPENDLGMADYHSCLADLSICLGTTMQIVPSGNLPLYTKKHGGRLVICNLQPTKHDRKADLMIHAYVDEIMTMLMKNLNLKIPKYTPKNDPTKTIQLTPETYMEWTISDYTVKKMKKVYEEKCGTKEARKRLEMIDDDLPLSIAQNLKRKRSKDDDDSDLEVLDVIVKSKKGSDKEPKKRGPKKKEEKEQKEAAYNSTIIVKKVSPAPPKKQKYEGEKITIKKNVTPTKTKYEIVPSKPKKSTKCEIVYNTDSDLCNDLDMICESDDDDNPPNFTYNFKLYLQDSKEVKKEEDKDVKNVEESCVDRETEKVEESKQIKEEIKSEESEVSQDKLADQGEKKVETEQSKSLLSEKNESCDILECNEIKKSREVTSEQPHEDALAKQDAKNSENLSNEEPREQNSEKSEKDNGQEAEQSNEKAKKQSAESTEESVAENNVVETSENQITEKTEKEIVAENEKQIVQESEKSNKSVVEEIRKCDEGSKNVGNNILNEEENIGKINLLFSENKNNFEDQMNVSETGMNKDNERNKASLENSNFKEIETLSSKDDFLKEHNSSAIVLDKSVEKEANASNSEEKNTEGVYNNAESEPAASTNSGVGNKIGQLDASSDAPQFENSLQMPDCNVNNPINENYMYNSEYSTSTGQAGVDYSNDNYYNNFSNQI